jgi:hypothetical protein
MAFVKNNDGTTSLSKQGKGHHRGAETQRNNRNDGARSAQTTRSLCPLLSLPGPTRQSRKMPAANVALDHRVTPGDDKRDALRLCVSVVKPFYFKGLRDATAFPNTR